MTNESKKEPQLNEPNSLNYDGETASESKRGPGLKRKAGSSYGNRKAKRAVAAMLTRSKDDGSAEDFTLTDEERAEKEQAKITSIDWNTSAK